MTVQRRFTLFNLVTVILVVAGAFALALPNLPSPSSQRADQLEIMRIYRLEFDGPVDRSALGLELVHRLSGDVQKGGVKYIGIVPCTGSDDIVHVAVWVLEDPTPEAYLSTFYDLGTPPRRVTHGLEGPVPSNGTDCH